MRKSGVYDLLDPEVKRVTDAFNAKKVESKCSLLKGWNDKKKELLRDNYIEGDGLIKAKDWFDNEAVLLDKYHDERKKQIANNKVFNNLSEEDYQNALQEAITQNAKLINANNDNYTMFLSRNDRKRAALKKLAIVRCRLGNGLCYDRNEQCDALVAFYRKQDAAIEMLRHTSMGTIRDYRSIWKTDAEMAQIEGEYQGKIDANKYELSQDILNIREAFDGEYEA